MDRGCGLCPVCERRDAQADDPLCVECRGFVTGSTSTVVDPVERVLNEHWRMDPLCTEGFQVCRCAWSIEGGPAYHRRHLAEKVYEALGLPGPAPWLDGPDVVHPMRGA